LELLSLGRSSGTHGESRRPSRLAARRLELGDRVQQGADRVVLRLEVVLDLLGLVERRLGILAGLVGALVRDAAEDSAGMVVAPTDTGAARCALNG
jgi:hypothetical protein